MAVTATAWGLRLQGGDGGGRGGGAIPPRPLLPPRLRAPLARLQGRLRLRTGCRQRCGPPRCRIRSVALHRPHLVLELPLGCFLRIPLPSALTHTHECIHAAE